MDVSRSIFVIATTTFLPLITTLAADQPVSAAPTTRGAPLFDNLGHYHKAVTTRNERAQRYFDQGLTLIYAFNHAEAARSFGEAARLDPACAMAWWGVKPPFAYLPMRHGLGAALLAAGRAADAEEVYGEDLRRSPNNGWSPFGLSEALRARGNPEAADAVRRQFEQAWIRADVKITASRL